MELNRLSSPKTNRLSSPKTKEQLNKYNKCVEQLEKARKVYQSKVQEFEEVVSIDCIQRVNGYI